MLSLAKLFGLLAVKENKADKLFELVAELGETIKQNCFMLNPTKIELEQADLPKTRMSGSLQKKLLPWFGLHQTM